MYSSFALQLRPHCRHQWAREEACSRKCSGLCGEEREIVLCCLWRPAELLLLDPCSGAARPHLIRLLSPGCWPPRLSGAVGVWDFLLYLRNGLCDQVAFLVELHHRLHWLLEGKDFCGRPFKFPDKGHIRLFNFCQIIRRMCIRISNYS